MPSFSIPLSGLDTSSTGLSVIANNLANLNTTGFKGQTAAFQDLFYQQIGNSGNGNAIQVGVGASVAGIVSQMTQGSIQNTGNSTDVAIQGQGFFIVDRNGDRFYTRAGNFSRASDGSLMTQDGAAVLGYQAVNGMIPANASLGALQIPTGLINPPNATTQMQLAMNLDASGGTGTVASSQQTGTGMTATTTLQTGSQLAFTDGTNTFTYTAAAGDTLANLVSAIQANPNFTAALNGNNLVITANNGKAVSFPTNTLTDTTSSLAESFTPSGTNSPAGTFSTTIVAYDALGTNHVLTFNFTKTAENTWNYQITIPAADLQAGGNTVVGSGTLTFNGNGQLVSPASNVVLAPITGLADGANPMNLTWNLFNANGAGLLTQLAGSSATSSTQQDGYASGTLNSFTIGTDGVISGIFSNGQTSSLGQIALATFSNDQGLVRSGSNEFVSSLASGAANIGEPGTGGRGSLSGGSLEQSNVDIATQFAQLILAERGYQANAKALTTFDQVTQTAIQLIS